MELCKLEVVISKSQNDSPHIVYLAVQNSSIGDLVPWSVALSDTTNNQSLQNTTE